MTRRGRKAGADRPWTAQRLSAWSRTIFARLAKLSKADRRWVLRGLSAAQLRELSRRWYGFEHDGQREPPGDWRIWLIQAGRGFGKTRAGAEWVSQVARDLPGARIALVAATIADGQRVMIQGPSGLIAVARDHEPVRWSATRRELTFASGAVATLYSAEAGEELRGPEHHVAWCDELAKWPRGEAAWDNMVMGLRLGERPRAVVTTTPRVNAAMRRVLAAPGVARTLGRTRDNDWLPETFVAAMLESYGGTRLGRQELGGELLEDVEGALWTRGLVETCRVGVDEIGKPVRVVIGVDAFAAAAEGGGAALQWISRGGTALAEIAVPAGAQALRPLAPVHGRIRPDDMGGVTIDWVRRSRVDTGWRDHVDQASGENREAWRIELSPSAPGAGPWESASPTLNIGAVAMAEIPPGSMIAIRQVGDFALSPPLSLPLT